MESNRTLFLFVVLVIVSLCWVIDLENRLKEASGPAAKQETSDLLGKWEVTEIYEGNDIIYQRRRTSGGSHPVSSGYPGRQNHIEIPYHNDYPLPR